MARDVAADTAGGTDAQHGQVPGALFQAPHELLNGNPAIDNQVQVGLAGGEARLKAMASWRPAASRP